MLLVKHSAESDATFSRKRVAFCTLHGLSQSDDHDRDTISSFVGSHSSCCRETSHHADVLSQCAAARLYAAAQCAVVEVVELDGADRIGKLNFAHPRD